MGKEKLANCIVLQHINIRSLVKNFTRLENHLYDEKPDFLSVSETWLNNNFDDKLINISNYEFVNNNRDNKRGGGVGVYVKSKFNFVKLNLDVHVNAFEHIWILFENTRKSTYSIIGTIYRPPSSKLSAFCEQMRNILNYILLCYKNASIYLIGDFNVDINKTDESLQFLEVFEQLNFIQFIKENTRISKVSQTKIDLLFSNKPHSIQSTAVIEKYLSDHCLISAKLTDFVCRSKNPIEFRPWKTLSAEKLLNTYINNKIDPFLIDNGSIEVLQNSIIRSLDDVCPLKRKVFNKPFAPWMSDSEVTKERRIRDKLRRNLKSNKADVSVRETYKNQVKVVRRLIDDKRKNYILANVKCSSDKNFWSLLKKLMGKSHIKVTTTPDELNEYYVNMAENLLQYKAKSTKDLLKTIDLLNENSNNISTVHFSFQQITFEDISNIINKMKNKKIGSCGISTEIIKLLGPFISETLKSCFNHCIVHSEFPNCLKNSKITPVAKVKTPKNNSDYRPIAIQPLISKIFEKVMLLQIEDHLQVIKPFEHQYGFRPGLSTVSLLRHVNQIVVDNLNQGLLTVLILLDFSKAFDTIAHHILLEKLSLLGFTPPALKLILSYLRPRTVKTIVNNISSKSLEINSGVPQGSILGPSLFNIYVADIIKTMPSDATLLQYADDTQILISFNKTHDLNHIRSKIQYILHTIESWSKANFLCLNLTKTQILPIFSRNSVYDKMNLFDPSHETPTFVKQAKNLGILYTYNMNWKYHFLQLLKNTKKIIFILRSFCYKYTKKSHIYLRTILYNYLIKPKMCYAIELFYDTNSYCEKIWHMLNKYVANLILQKYAHKSDTEYLNLSSLYYECNKSILSAVKKKKIHVEVQKREYQYGLRRTKRQFSLPAITNKKTLEEQIVQLLNDDDLNQVKL